MDYYDFFQSARDGAKALADGDVGRSGFLANEVAAAMEQLSVAECEWLSTVVVNGAFNRALLDTSADPVDVEMRSTATGEIWDI